MKIGSNVKKLRELRNFKQDYLADVLCITQSTYSRYEKDELHFDDKMLETLSKQLGLSVVAIQQFDVNALFRYLEDVDNTELPENAHEQELAEELVDKLTKDNSFLQQFLQDLTQTIKVNRIENQLVSSMFIEQLC